MTTTTPTNPPDTRPFITAFGKVRCERCHDFGPVCMDEYRRNRKRPADGTPLDAA